MIRQTFLQPEPFLSAPPDLSRPVIAPIGGLQAGGGRRASSAAEGDPAGPRRPGNVVLLEVHLI